MNLDLVVTDSDGRKTLIDMKYKTLGEHLRRAISEGDHYQMHAYARGAETGATTAFSCYTRDVGPSRSDG